MFSWTDFAKDVSGPILGYVIGGVGIALWAKLRAQVKQPAMTEKELTLFKAEITQGLGDLGVKFDNFSKNYQDGAAKNKQFEIVLLQTSDFQFKALTSQTGSIRKLAESVCNGNKPEAMRLCDEADNYCKEGQDLKQQFLIDQAVGKGE